MAGGLAGNRRQKSGPKQETVSLAGWPHAQWLLGGDGTFIHVSHGPMVQLRLKGNC